MTTIVSPTRDSSLKRRTLTVLASLGTAAALLAPFSASAQIALGTAANFGVLGATPSVTNTGPTVVTGNVGIFPAASITGFPPGTLTGSLQAGTPAAGTAQTDLTVAYTAAAAAVCNTDLTGVDLGGLTLAPGVYCFSSSAQLTGNLTLDFQGNPNAAFLFKVGSALTTASASSVLSINTGGAACLPNINFQIGSSATLGTGSNIAGNILAQASITGTTGSILRGRALARTGAVTLDTNQVGGCPFAATRIVGGSGITEIPTLQEWNLIVLGLLLACVGGWYARRSSVTRRR